MDGKSLDIIHDRLNKLKELFPEVFTEDRVDWEKLKAALGEDINFSNERYVLNWAGKSDAFRALQARTTATLVPDREESVNFDGTGHIFIEGENLEVLKVLQKSYYGKIKMIYIDPPYNTGNDNFIYPDRFSENKDDYLKRIGDKDEEGYMTREGLFRKNSKDSGYYHSNWLSMMYPRLFLAKNLLKDDGVIFVSIDDNEVHNLRLLMNEIFGEENFVGQVVWKNATDNNPTRIATEHEYVCVFTKNKEKCEAEWKSSISEIKDKLVEIGGKLISENKNLESLQAAYKKWFRENKAYLGPLDRYKYIDFGGVYTGSQSVHNPGKEGYRYDVIHPKTGKPCKQPLMGYRFPEETMKTLLGENKILFGEDESKIIEIKVYAKDYQEKLSSLIELDGRLGAYDLKNLFVDSARIFNNPKPVSLLNTIFPFILKNNDLILDFFSGACTTAHTVLDLNMEDGGSRNFICVQLPEKCDEKSEAYKAGYKTIADIGKERIRRVIQEIEKEQKEKKNLFTDENKKSDLGFKVFKLRSSNFKIWRGDVIENGDELEKQLNAFVDPVGDILVKKLEERMSLDEVIDKLYALLRELFFIRQPVDYLYPLKNFLSLSKPLDFFTLNYDLSLETAFENNSLLYTTGYKKRNKGLPIWAPSEFEKRISGVRIFKLHGSVNWGQFFGYPPPPSRSEPTASASYSTDAYISNYPERVEFDPFPLGLVEPPKRTSGMVSLMNFGTRKELLYMEGQFTVLFNHFLNSLNRARTCVVAGYSFRDDRINKILEEAVVSRKGGLHLVIVDPSLSWSGHENTILRKFIELEWATPIYEPLEEVLRNGSLLKTVKSTLEVTSDSKKIIPPFAVNVREESDKEKPDIKDILNKWKILGISFDLAFFWMSYLAPELRALEECTNESYAIKIGQLLMPLNRKVRDLCYHLRWVYEAMHFDGAYGGEYLETIKVTPRLTKDFSHFDLVRKWLPVLGRAVSIAFNAYNLWTEDFKRAVNDPNYGKDVGAPNNLSAAAFLIGHDIRRTYEIVTILNDIYKGAGYEEPFEMITKDFLERNN